MKSKAVAAAPTEESLVEHYISQLTKLSPNARLELIARLSQTLKDTSAASPTNPAVELPDFVGAWADDEEADELEARIRQSRHFSSKPELGQW